jgi:hypothetical protein
MEFRVARLHGSPAKQDHVHDMFSGCEQLVARSANENEVSWRLSAVKPIPIGNTCIHSKGGNGRLLVTINRNIE